MATPSPEEALRILEEHIAFVESHPDEFPAPKDAADLVRMNMEAHQRELDEKYPNARHDALVRRASHFPELGDHTQYSDEELLASVVRYTSMGDFPDIELDRVYAECVAGDDRLEERWMVLTASENLRADFHLDGADVDGHSINAASIIELISGVNKATKSTSKARAQEINADHKGQKNRKKAQGGKDLRLVAISPGSFEFTLETVKAPVPEESEATLGASEVGESVDDMALRTVLETLYSDGDDELLRQLPSPARRALLPAAKVIAADGLNVQVKVTQRGKRVVRKSRDVVSARTLVAKLKEPDVRKEFVTGVFKFDGYKESTDSVFLMISDAESRRFLVEEAPLLHRLRNQPEGNEDVWLAVRVEIIVTKKAGAKTQTTCQLIEARPAEQPSDVERDEYEEKFTAMLDRLRRDNEE